MHISKIGNSDRNQPHFYYPLLNLDSRLLAKITIPFQTFKLYFMLRVCVTNELISNWWTSFSDNQPYDYLPCCTHVHLCCVHDCLLCFHQLLPEQKTQHWDLHGRKKQPFEKHVLSENINDRGLYGLGFSHGYNLLPAKAAIISNWCCDYKPVHMFSQFLLCL